MSEHTDSLKGRRSLAGRIVAVAAKALAGVVLLIVVAVAGALVFANTAPGRRLATREVNRALADSFRGSLTVEGLGGLGLDGVDDAKVLVRDADGRIVLMADGISARVAVVPLVRALVLGTGPLPITVTRAGVREVEAILIPDANDQPSLAHVFEPRHPAAPGSPPSRGVRLDLHDARVGRVWTHGKVASFDALDAVIAHLRASFAYDATTTTAEIQPFDLDARGLLPQDRPLTGKVEARLRLPANGDRSVRGSFDGGAGNIALALHATVLGDEVEAAVRALGGGGTVDVRAIGSIGEDRRADATVTVEGVDPHAIVSTAPETSIRARARVRAHLDARGALSGEAELRSEAIRLRSASIPPISANARFTNDHAVGRVHAEESGARADVDFDLLQRGASRTVDVEGTAQVPDLSRVAPLRGRGLRGAASVHTAGHADLIRKTLDAEIDAQLAGLELGQDSARFAIVRAQAHGPFDAPALRATVHALDLDLGGRAIDRVQADASGSLERPTITGLVQSGGLLVHGGGTLSLRDGFTAEGLALDVSRGETRATASVDRLHGRGDEVELEGLNVSGIGSPVAGEARFSPATIAVRLSAPEIDSRRLSILFGKEHLALEGHTSIDVDVHADREGASGHVNGEFHSLPTRDLPRGDVRVALSLDGRRVDGALSAAFDDVRADVELSGVTVGGPPTAVSSWKRTTGTIDLDSNVDLGTLRRLVPAGVLPFEQSAGTLALKARVSRERPDSAPDATIEASTRGLVLVLPAKASDQPSFVDHPEEAQPPPVPWATRGVDAHVSASLEGRSKKFALDGYLFDKGGPLVSLKLETLAPLADLGDAVAVLERTPLTFHVEVPEREVSELPPPMRPAALRGRATGTLDVKGAPIDPRAELHMTLRGLQPMESKSAVPLDGSIDATYDGRKGDAHVHVVRASRADDVVADARANIDARVADFVRPSGDTAPWSAGASVTLHDFPLEAIPQVATRHIGGLASGSVVLDGLHRDATLDTHLQISRLKLGREVFDRGNVRARVDHDGLRVSTRLEKPGSLLDATLKGTTQWGAELSPSLDTTQAVEATLEAHAFRAAALMPFLQGTIHQLDGKIEARASVHVQPDFKDGTMDGDVVLSQGRFDAPAVGGSFHDVGARVTIRPWGTLRVDDITASGVEGNMKASATAQLDGMKLRSAKLVADIKHGDRMPITVQGVSLGEASGHVQVDATMSPDQSALDATVDIPKFEMDLPQSTGHAVQSLGPADKVVVGMHESDGRFVVLPLQRPEKPREAGSTKIRLKVVLGDDVWIKRDTSLAVRLTGSPVVELADAVKVNGAVRVTSGKAEVFGKRFKIQQDSTISFTGEPDNPQLTVTALYESPDKTKIYADVVGTPRSLKVHLRSDPPQPEDAVLSLLLFGSAEGIGGTPPSDQQPDATQRAAGLAGGVVTQGINKALAGVTSLDIATRLDTSDAANPKPEVEVRISNDVVTRVTVQTGMPAPGEPPDRTLLSIDWTFKPRWILESTVGDAGSTFMDVLWRRRY